MSAPLLRVEGLNLQRGRRRLAVSVNFTVAPGQYVELAGANGSGKTTLLRVLAGLAEKTRHARIEFAQGAAASYFAARHGFRPELEVGAQLALALSLFNRAPDEKTLTALLTRVGLLRQRGQRVGSLSEGQIRRLMLAVMAGAGRRVWLIDEPLNALDAEGVALLGRLIADHLAAGGAAVVATHQTLASRLPELGAHCAGRVCLGAGGVDSVFEPASPAPGVTGVSEGARTASGSGLGWVLRREFALLLARPQDALWPAVFHWMVVCLFPFGLGADSGLLMRIGPGVFWVSALLAMLLAMQRLFAIDYEQGAIDQIQVAGLPLTVLAAGKLVANFTVVGLPLALASFPLGVQYGLDGGAMVLLAGSMALGLVTLCALGTLFAALGLMARQAQLAVSLASLPCFVPVLIFGSAVTDSVNAGLSAQAPLAVLAALAVLSLVALPAVAARVLALAMD